MTHEAMLAAVWTGPSESWPVPPAVDLGLQARPEFVTGEHLASVAFVTGFLAAERVRLAIRVELDHLDRVQRLLAGAAAEELNRVSVISR